MKHWWVYTPEIGEVVPVLDDGSGPTEYYREYVCVDAPNKREAKVEAVRVMRDRGMKYVSDPYASPFTGLVVESAVCPHGFCACDCERNMGDYCLECEQLDFELSKPLPVDEEPTV